MKLTLVKKQQEAGDSVSFFWQASPPFSWSPGQFIYLTLNLPELDPRGNVRHFTIASSPSEDLVRITTRISDYPYKQKLNSLEIGAIIEGTGPRGDFVLDEQKSTPQIFLAGGIGITPFRSFIKFAIDKGIATPMYLIYSNSTPEEIIFREELDEWSKTSHNLTISYTITKPEETKTPWSGLTGRINAEMIKSLITNHQSLTTSTFWVCGPPAFVSAMQEELQKLGISPEKIEVEQFTGY